VGILGCLFLK